MTITELDRWVGENNVSGAFEYGKGWWDYVELVRRFSSKFELADVRVAGHYIVHTPPPEEELPMPAVLLTGKGVLVALKSDFGARARWPLEWTVTLQWHIDTYLTYTFDPENEKRPNRTRIRMAKSELLFPSGATGSFQVAGRLGKPFDDVSQVMRERVSGFRKTITPKSMRRSNKDLLWQEGISQLVAQAINSHDDVMHKHYSTVSEVEKGAALAKVIHLFPKAPKVAKKKKSR